MTEVYLVTKPIASLKQIAASIERFGLTNRVQGSDEGEIIAGHGRVEAAKLLGLRTVPTIALSHLSATGRRAYVLADNKLALNAGWDRDMLAIGLQGLIDLDFDVELTGFGIAEIDFIIDDANSADPDQPDEPADMVFTDPPYNVAINGNVCGLGEVRHDGLEPYRQPKVN